MKNVFSIIALITFMSSNTFAQYTELRQAAIKQYNTYQFEQAKKTFHDADSAADAPTQNDIQNLRSVGFSDRDILHIVEVTAYYAYVNRIAGRA